MTNIKYLQKYFNVSPILIAALKKIIHLLCMHTASFQLCLILCDPIDWHLPDSSVHGILQARILEWIAMTSSRGSSRPKDQIHVSHVSLHWFSSSLPLGPSGKPNIFVLIYFKPSVLASIIYLCYIGKFCI